MIKMLVVDDDADFLAILKRKIELDSNFVVDTAASIESAQEIVREREYDIITVDLRFPGDTTEYSGLRFLEEVKKRHPKIGVVVITASTSKEVLLDACNMGADKFINKPIAGSALEEMLGEMVLSMSKRDFEEAVVSAAAQASQAYDIATESMQEANETVDKITKAEAANGVVLETYIKECRSHGG